MREVIIYAILEAGSRHTRKKGIDMLNSQCVSLGQVSLPKFQGTRLQMMPFLVHDPDSSVPAELACWLPLLRGIAVHSEEVGVGFLTIDEAELRKGEHHRRPGLHVDCGGPLLAHGGSPPPPGHGGSPPPKPNHGASGGGGGMYLLASSVGCRGFLGSYDDSQGDDGDCEHLRRELVGGFDMEGGKLYWANHHFIHETLPAKRSGPRQFVRVSMPSDAPWHANYTQNPLGIVPSGRIAPPRDEMQFRV